MEAAKSHETDVNQVLDPATVVFEHPQTDLQSDSSDQDDQENRPIDLLTCLVFSGS